MATGCTDGKNKWFQIGDRVKKTSGYLWPGIIVAIFQTTSHQVRVVVECTVPEVKGALHIYNLDQIEKDVDENQTCSI